MSKIAFCFLVVQNLKNMDLWRKFFKGHENEYSLYFHISGNKYDDKEYKWEPEMWNNRVETHGYQHTATKWGSPSLVKAEGILYKCALKDPENKYFCLISESDIPLFTFSETKAIIDTYLKGSKSFLTFGSSKGYDSAMFKDCFPKKFIPTNNKRNPDDRRYWIMWNAHQWKILNRRDAEEFVRMASNKEYINAYKKCFVYDPEALAPDEYMFPNWIALKYGSKGIRKRFIGDQTTYVDFDDKAVHALEYKHVSKDRVKDMCSDYYKSIFARKFPKNKNLLRRHPLCSLKKGTTKSARANLKK